MNPLILTGVTASGKTSIAIELAQVSPIPIEIINADSLLVYQGFNIGTAKPTLSERQGIPHHLIDILSPSEIYSAAQFIKDVHQCVQEIQSRCHLPLIVGGSGFYLKALLFGMWDAPPTDPVFRKSLEGLSTPELFSRLSDVDMDWAQKISIHDRYRLIRGLEIYELTHKKPSDLERHLENTKPWTEVWIVDRTPNELHERIHLRTKQMISLGLIQETEALLNQHGPHTKPINSVGYKQVVDFLNGQKPQGRQIQDGLPGLISEIELATRQLAKRQRTWLKGMKQKEVSWFHLETDKLTLQNKFLQKWCGVA